MTELNHEKLRKIAVSILKEHTWRNQGFGCTVVASELVSSAADIPDAIGWTWGHSVLIECKVSRSDFFADAQKPHRQAGTGAGEQRFFLTPGGLIKPAELPPEWGLIEVDGRKGRVTVDCPKRRLDSAGHASEKRMLLSLVRRVRMREFLIISPAHMDELLEERHIADSGQSEVRE
jgi:hypothetical protein